jgi:chromosome segregation ATPase
MTVLAEEKAAENEEREVAYLSALETQDEEEAAMSEKLDEAEAKGKKLESELYTIGRTESAAEAALDRATADMADATSANAGIIELQLKSQAALIQLIESAQTVHHRRHEDLKKQHEKHGQKVKKLEALIEVHADRLRSQDHHKECDDLRAKVIHAKAKLATASAALGNCLQAKKDIQEKMDKVEALKDVAAKSLEQCLKTKASLKAQLDECHHRRDSARAKLKECLAKKEDLKAKIDACHEKRLEARKKLDQCLASKKVLNEKIAKAKKSLAGAKPEQASLLEVENGSSATDLVDDIEAALAALHTANINFDELAQEDLDLGAILQTVLVEIEGTNAEDKEVREALEAAELLEMKSQEDMMQLQTTLKDAYKALTGIDYKANEAESELAASGAETDQAQEELSSLLQSMGIVQH